MIRTTYGDGSVIYLPSLLPYIITGQPYMQQIQLSHVSSATMVVAPLAIVFSIRGRHHGAQVLHLLIRKAWHAGGRHGRRRSCSSDDGRSARHEPAVAGSDVVVLAVAADVRAHGLDVVVEPKRLERAGEVLGRHDAAVLRPGLLGRLAGDEADELDGAVEGEVLGARGDLDALGDHLPHEAHEVGHRQPGGGRARTASLPARRGAVSRRDLRLPGVTDALLRTWTEKNCSTQHKKKSC